MRRVAGSEKGCGAEHAPPPDNQPHTHVSTPWKMDYFANLTTVPLKATPAIKALPTPRKGDT